MMNTDGPPISSQQQQPCFTSIQSRKFGGPPCHPVTHLCPSMDLIIFGLQQQQQQQQHHHGSSTSPRKDPHDHLECSSTSPSPSSSTSSTTLWIHRILSWQKLTAFTLKDAATFVAWSPDGRQVAMAQTTNQVSLYQVEALSKQNGTTAAATTTTTAHSDMDGTPPHHTFTVDYPVTNLSWVHVGRPHPTAWNATQNQIEQELSWRYVWFMRCSQRKEKRKKKNVHH